MTDGSDVLFFGNPADHRAEIVAALGWRALFGFPAAGGTRDGTVVRYVLISQQKTMLGEPDGTTSARVQSLQRVFDGAGFPTTISADIGGRLLGHAAFVVPIAFALSRVGGDAATLAADRAVLRLMVLATREAFTAPRRGGNMEMPPICGSSTPCRPWSSSATGAVCSPVGLRPPAHADARRHDSPDGVGQLRSGLWWQLLAWPASARTDPQPGRLRDRPDRRGRPDRPGWVPVLPRPPLPDRPTHPAQRTPRSAPGRWVPRCRTRRS